MPLAWRDEIASVCRAQEVSSANESIIAYVQVPLRIAKPMGTLWGLSA